MWHDNTGTVVCTCGSLCYGRLASTCLLFCTAFKSANWIHVFVVNESFNGICLNIQVLLTASATTCPVMPTCPDIQETAAVCPLRHNDWNMFGPQVQGCKVSWGSQEHDQHLVTAEEEKVNHAEDKSGHKGWVKHDPEDKRKHIRLQLFMLSPFLYFSETHHNTKKYTPLGCEMVALKQRYTSYGQWSNYSKHVTQGDWFFLASFHILGCAILCLWHAFILITTVKWGVHKYYKIITEQYDQQFLELPSIKCVMLQHVSKHEKAINYQYAR